MLSTMSTIVTETGQYATNDSPTVSCFLINISANEQVLIIMTAIVRKWSVQKWIQFLLDRDTSHISTFPNLGEVYTFEKQTSMTK